MFTNSTKIGRPTDMAPTLLLAVLAAGCGGGGAEAPSPQLTDAEESSAALSVYVVNYPLMYFAERIGGDHVEVVFPAPAGVDPAFWQPGVDVVADYQMADLIVRNARDRLVLRGRHAALPARDRVALPAGSAGFGVRRRKAGMSSGSSPQDCGTVSVLVLGMIDLRKVIGLVPSG